MRISRGWNVAALFAALALAVPGSAAAQSAEETDPDIRDIRPIVMLLVDSSGSMERMTGGAGAALPMCAGSSAGTNERNRWTTVVEALTGTWNETDFFCTAIDRGAYASSEEDFNYYLPYHQPPLGITQNGDGILDTYLDRIKFGLMTFDATYTFTNFSHPLLMYRSDFEARGADNQQVWGGFSYGDARPLMYEGCPDEFMVDSGARNGSASAGALVSVGLESDDHTLINATIQSQLRTARPYGGTPTAALLHDLRYYVQNHPDVTSDDPFAECRSRVAILLTDGQPDGDFRDDRFNCDSADGVCPYDLPEVTAADLCQYDSSARACSGDLDALFVVAFDVDDTASVSALNLIADAGGTSAALLATDRASLVARLAEAIDRAAPGNTTRSRPAFTGGSSTFSVTTDAPSQLEFNAGFRVGLDGTPWTGVLERTRYLCDETNQPVPEDVDDRVRFDQVLNDRVDPRVLYTVTTTDPSDMTGNLIIDRDDFALTADDPPGAITDRSLTPFTDSLDPELFGIPAASAGANARRDDIVAWVRGLDGTVREDSRLGDIYHSSPVAVPPPRVDIADESYNLFRASAGVADRPTMLYVGTNDGILHAFVAEDWANADATLDYDAGHELWGFIPPVLVPRLESATTSHQVLLDGTPVVRDLYLSRQPGLVASGSIYRTVLVMGFRDGARGYFALDVTDPLTPVFLWQFTGNRDSSGDTPMGNSFPEPGLGQALVEVDSVLSERAIAILPGGEGELDVATATANGSAGCSHTVAIPRTDGTTSQRTAGRCWQERGRVLHVIDVATGQVLRTFDSTYFNAPLTGGVAVTPGDVGTVAQRAFFTDADGVIWTLDLRLNDPADWEVRPLHDMFWDIADKTQGQPSYPPPRVSSDTSGQLVVLQGSGNIDLLDSVLPNRVVSVTEVLDTSSGSPVYTSSLNWEIRLRDGEQVTGPIELFEGTAYFATFESSADPDNLCELGQSRLWGVDYIEASAVVPAGYTDVLGNRFPTAAFADGTGGFDHFDGPYADSLILGVGITQRPTCVRGVNITDPYIPSRFVVQEVGGGQFQLTAQVSGGTGTREGAIQSISQTLPTPPSFTTIDGFAGQVDY